MQLGHGAASLASSANGLHGLEPPAQRPSRGHLPGFLQPTSNSTAASPPAACSRPPATITSSAFHFQLTAPAKFRASWEIHPSPPWSPPRRPGSPVDKLLLRGVHSPVHGYTTGVPGTLGISPKPLVARSSVTWLWKL